MDLGMWIAILTVIGTIISGLLTLVIKGMKVLGRIEVEQKVMEERMDNVHDGCHIKVGSIEKIESDIKELQTSDKGREIKLVGIETKLANVEVMTTAMYKHFFEEGIKDGRRQED